MVKSEEKVYNNGSFSESKGAESQFFHGTLSNLIPPPTMKHLEIRVLIGSFPPEVTDTEPHVVATLTTGLSLPKHQDRDLQMPENARFKPPPSPKLLNANMLVVARAATITQTQ